MLWGEEEYYRVYLQTDKQLEAALTHMAEAAELVAVALLIFARLMRIVNAGYYWEITTYVRN